MSIALKREKNDGGQRQNHARRLNAINPLAQERERERQRQRGKSAVNGPDSDACPLDSAA